MGANGAATTVYRAAMILSILLFLTALIELIVGGILPFSSDNAKFAYAVAPTLALPLLFLVLILSILVNPIGTASLFMGSRKLALVHFFSSILLNLLLLILFVFLVMAGNGVVAIQSRNVNSNERASGVDVAIDTFADETQRRIVEFALSDPDVFLRLQDADDCCGLNAQAIFGFGIDNFEAIDIHTGLQCSGIQSELDDVIAASGGVFNDAALTAVDESTRLSVESFFCEQDFAGNLRGLAQTFAIFLGIQAFFQVTLSFFFGLLTYMYEVQEGGLKPDEDPLVSRPKVENTVLVKAGYTSGQKSRGRTPIASVKSKNKGKAGQNTGNQHIRFG